MGIGRWVWAFLALGGCYVVYPGDGSLVVVDYDSSFERMHLTLPDGSDTTVAEQLKIGIRYWDVVGAHLRTRDQLDGERQSGAQHLTVSKDKYQDLHPNSDAFYWEEQGEIVLFTDWLSRPLAFCEVSAVLAHEAGHALDLQHNSGATSVMAAHPSSRPCALEDEDVAEFLRRWR